MAEVKKLTPGLYVVAWNHGGESLAAVGMTVNGGRWLAPVNWVQPSDRPTAWHYVASVRAVART